MNNPIVRFARLLGQAAVCLALGMGSAAAAITGLTGPNFSLAAQADYINTGDGQSIYSWGYAASGVSAPAMQYPGPTLVVNQGETVTVTLTNQLPVPTSIVFPGQEGVTATVSTPGLLAGEAQPGVTTTYTFTAGRPGTYMYHSGTRPDLQVEMGLVGALIVRPAVANPLKQAYGHTDSAFDYEYLFLLTEMDAKIHQQAESASLSPTPQVDLDKIDTSNYFSTLWFINGRNGTDTLLADNLPTLPTQPYSALARAHPGDKVLLRLIGGGHDLHPFHHHGNNSVQIARDGRLLGSTPGAGADLATSNYTIAVAPGSTYDAIFTWTGKGLGWDIFPNDPATPHTCTPDANGFDPTSREWCADHGKPLPVALPGQLDINNGPFWSGSPFLGTAGSLPPGQGGFNANAGYFFMWHSHTEKELTNDNIFPGGMMTMFIVEPVGVPIK